ncbi:MAG TPA: vWA domain-containing protein [Acidiferrobacter sp.]|nr:vWA domain-containing protein [Acidiferrobacter sp.]
MRARHAVLAICLSLAGCAAGPQGRAVYVLVDTSGSYIKAVPKAGRIIRYMLGTLEPGDTIAVARITSLSFTNKDRVAAVTLSRQPAQADGQKRAIAARVATFVAAMAHRRGTSYTDISGALLEAGHFLASVSAAHKDIIVVSDMRQDLPYGAVRNLKLPLKGVTVFAVNVIKSRGENLNPVHYFTRMHRWKTRIAAGGGRLVVVHQLARLPTLMRIEP